VHLISSLRDVAAPGNATLAEALTAVEQELAAIRDEGPPEGSRSTETRRERELELVKSLPELIKTGDGLSDYGRRSVDYLYARRASKLIETASLAEVEDFLVQRPAVKQD